MDIQPAFHEKKAVAHMCTYLSESEDETSSSIKINVVIMNK